MREAFEEAHRCFDAQAYTAATLMARRMVEAIAHDRGAVGGSLAASVQSLKDSGDLEGRLADWADLLRTRGNLAAHELDSTVGRQDAEDLLRFAEALADYVYTLRLRYEEYLVRTTNDSNAQKPPPF